MQNKLSHCIGKHEIAYASAHTGYSFAAFICSCFGALGPSAIRYLLMLAMLELGKHEALRRLQGMDPWAESERAQYRANWFRSSSESAAMVMAKANIERLTGALSLPIVAPVSCHHLAQKNLVFSDVRDLRKAP